jgi:hypothetical protein
MSTTPMDTPASFHRGPSPVWRRLLLAGLLGLAPWLCAGDDSQSPAMSPEASQVPHDRSVFGSDPVYQDSPYDPAAQLEIYGGKHAVESQRPLELGRQLYTAGPYDEGLQLGLGERNRFYPHLILYGDWRTGVAYNDTGEREVSRAATRLNLDIDLKLTATERIHAFMRPLDDGKNFSRLDFGGDSDDQELELDGNFETLFFEGDLGSIASGFSEQYSRHDMPFAIGLMPLVMQNGIWIEDAVTGVAFTIPAWNSSTLDISNADLTLFAAWDRVSSPAFTRADGRAADHVASIYGVAGFVDMAEGYLEWGYAYLDSDLDRLSYHNWTAAFTRRYGGWLSNSVRVIGNFGQDPANGRTQTADGTLFLIENSLISSQPLTLVPYLNFFAGFDRPQSLARDPGAGGPLKNTGLAYETDGLTGFPKLDDSARDTYGAALGVEYLFDLDQQLVLEFAAHDTMDHPAADQPSQGEQYAVSMRYQRPLNKSWILRVNLMRGWLADQEDLFGIGCELRFKF